MMDMQIDCGVKLQSSSSSYVKYEETQVVRAIYLRSQTLVHKCPYTYNTMHAKMPKQIHAFVWRTSLAWEDQPFWLWAQMSDLYPFRFDLWWCPDLSVADRYVLETRERERERWGRMEGVKYKNKIKMPTLRSAGEQIEVSCWERRESVPIQVANRRWGLRGERGEEREREEVRTRGERRRRGRRTVTPLT